MKNDDVHTGIRLVFIPINEVKVTKIQFINMVKYENVPNTDVNNCGYIAYITTT